MKQSILDNLRSELLNRGSFDTFPVEVWKASSSLNTYGTNAIEGNTLTQEEVDQVIIGRQGVKKPINEVMETIQHASAFMHLIDRRTRAIDLITILELHDDVFKGLLADHGQWRRVNVVVRGASFTPPRPEKLVARLEDLRKEYDRRDLTGEDVFSLGAWIHYSFESIHPFSDGNGRVGRLLLNLHFLKHNWPPVNIMPVDRGRYLDALGQPDKGTLQPLTEYFKMLMGGSLLNYLSFVGTEQDELRTMLSLNGKSHYSPKYLSLRARQGELPAVRIKNEWNTSERALALYVRELGRN
jgi:fido (protein-threonine AMPylation protein)